MSRNPQEITTLLIGWRGGDRTAADELVAVVYPELRRLAAHYLRQERAGHTLQATALVHELFMRLFASEPVSCENRAHFFAVAAQQLRRILIDYARSARAAKRGGDFARVTLANIPQPMQENLDLLALDEALTRLEELDPRVARVVELRFFAGLEEKDAATVLDISVATVKRDWTFAKAWLVSQLTASGPEV